MLLSNTVLWLAVNEGMEKKVETTRLLGILEGLLSGSILWFLATQRLEQGREQEQVQNPHAVHSRSKEYDNQNLHESFRKSSPPLIRPNELFDGDPKK